MEFQLPQQIYSTRPWAREVDVNSIADKMGLVPVRVLGGGASSVVILCEHGIVLKLLPSVAEARQEQETLNMWPMPEMSPLKTRGQALALRYHPGQSLNEIDWSKDIHRRVFASCRKIHAITAPPTTPTLYESKVERFQELSRRLRKSDGIENWHHALLEIIRDKALNSIAGGERHNLIHGDFQPGNLLMTADGNVLPIDPKGLAGDPYYDYSSWLVNSPNDWEKRFVVFLGLLGDDADHKRLLTWCEYLLVDGWISAKWRHTNDLVMWEEELLKLRHKYLGD